MVISFDTFTEVVRCVFLGGNQVVNGKAYTLEPSIIRPYDFLRTTPEFGSKNEMNRLFTDLSEEFTGTIKSEMYRKEGGWIQRGYKEGKVKQFQINDDVFLVPILSKPSIGIDTSTDNDQTYVCFAFYDNYRAGYHYLEEFLKIPKSKTGWPEFKWNKLNPDYRRLVNDHLEHLLKISCRFILYIKTNALRESDEKLADVFIKLIQGCYSNYNHHDQARLRFRNNLFKLSNEVPIHCDADFRPLTPDKIVKHFVKLLANESENTALHAEKDSHESEPIQLADILCGVLKSHVINKNRKFLQPWEFSNKLKSRTKEREAKCYVWDNPSMPVLA